MIAKPAHLMPGYARLFDPPEDGPDIDRMAADEWESQPLEDEEFQRRMLAEFDDLLADGSDEIGAIFQAGLEAHQGKADKAVIAETCRAACWKLVDALRMRLAREAAEREAADIAMARQFIRPRRVPA